MCPLDQIWVSQLVPVYTDQLVLLSVQMESMSWFVLKVLNFHEFPVWITFQSLVSDSRFNIWWDKHKGRRLKGRIHYLVFEPIREMGWRAPSAQFECGSDIIVKVRADWSLKDWASLSFTKEQQTNKWNKNIRDVSECIIELEIELASKCEVFREHRKHGSFKTNIQVGLFVVDAQLEGNPASKLVALAASN